MAISPFYLKRKGNHDEMAISILSKGRGVVMGHLSILSKGERGMVRGGHVSFVSKVEGEWDGHLYFLSKGEGEL